MSGNDKKSGGNVHAVPKWDVRIERAAAQQFLRIEDVAAGSVIEILAAGRRYALRVIDPARRRVELTSDDDRCIGPVEGCLQGSKISPWGSSIFMGRIAISLCPVFSSAAFAPELMPPEIDLPPVDHVRLDGVAVLPAEDADDP